MARGPLPYIAQKTNGDAVSGATVAVNIRGGGPAQVYAAETGATLAASPLLTDVDGKVTAWLDEGSYDVTISGPTITTTTRALEVNRGNGVMIVGDGCVALGAFKHVGNIGFFNTNPVGQSTGWGATITPPAIGGGKAQLTASSTLNDVIRYMSEIAAALKAYGLLGT